MPVRVPDDCEYLSAAAEDADTLAAVDDLAFRHGENSSAYIVTERGWETFWGPERRGVVRFTRWLGSFVYVTGGVIAAGEDQPRVLAKFREFLELNRWNALFVCLGRDQLPPFRELGCQVSKAGEEPIIRLATASWCGKHFEWLRRQENFCKRQGLELVEIAADAGDRGYREDIVPQLETVSREHLAATLHGRELEYFVGRFRPLEMGRRRLFAVCAGDRIEAFLVCNPCCDGRMWAIEMFRRREDAPRGVIPFAMLQAMRQMQAEGVELCSLSVIPTVRATKPIRGDSWAARGGCFLWWHGLNWLYDVRGMYHFKSRFRPESREVYFVSWPRTTFWSMIGFTRVFGLTRFSWLRLAGSVWRKFGKREARESLAEPQLRPEKVLRQLPKKKPPQEAPLREGE